MIQAEGLESLSEHELRQACRERGHLGLLSTEEMRLEVYSVLLAHAMFFFPFDTRITTSDSKYYLSCIKENLLSWIVTKIRGRWGRGTGYGPCERFLQGGDENDPAFLGRDRCSRVEERYPRPRFL